MTWREAAVRGLRRVLPSKTTVLVVGTAGTLVGLEVATHAPSRKLRSSSAYHSIADEVVTPAMRRFLNPETAHNVAVYFAEKGLAPIHHPSAAEQRCVVATTLKFNGASNKVRPLAVPNPVGLAAGFDKNAQIVRPMLQMGFGFVEVGTVTVNPQPGNPSPRMFRLPADLAIINRYGFNSAGAGTVESNLKAYYEQQNEQVPPPDASMFARTLHWLLPRPPRKIEGAVGINLGKNRSSVAAADVLADYTALITRLGPYADYLVLNISSPNTAGLRDWQTGDALKSLLTACVEAREALVGDSVPPLFVKLAPDLTDEQLVEIAHTCQAVGIDGIVVSNTTNQRPADLIGHHLAAKEAGGLSGKPVKDMATACIRKLYAATEGKLPIIGVGGIASGYDAYEKLRAGASLVQVYSMMVYSGPGVVSRIRSELADLMLLHGHRNVRDVVGLDHEDIYWQKRQERLALRERAEQQLYAHPDDGGETDGESGGDTMVVPAMETESATPETASS